MNIGRLEKITKQKHQTQLDVGCNCDVIFQNVKVLNILNDGGKRFYF